MAFTDRDIQAMGASLTKIKSGTETADWIVGSLTSIGEIGLDREEIDVTTLDSPDGVDEFMAGKLTPTEVPFSGYIKKAVDEETVERMMELIDDSTNEDWVVEFPSGATWEFTAFIKSFKTDNIEKGGLISFSGSMKISGKPEYTKSV